MLLVVLMLFALFGLTGLLILFLKSLFGLVKLSFRRAVHVVSSSVSTIESSRRADRSDSEAMNSDLFTELGVRKSSDLSTELGVKATDMSDLESGVRALKRILYLLGIARCTLCLKRSDGEHCESKDCLKEYISRRRR